MTLDGKMSRYRSWGRYPVVEPSMVRPVFWPDDLTDFTEFAQPVLPFAYGRSYGDSCLNEGGVLLDVSYLKRLIAFDEEAGVLRCEAGVSLVDILEITVPRGWFLPVVPGTKMISIGGAIANDIHGKNHHRSGTFGCHLTRFELVRSNGDRILCSPKENREMFGATIGGLGLTGVILWAEFRLKRIVNPLIRMERIRFGNLDEFFKMSAESNDDFEYTVAWVDCMARRKKLGRGIFMRGNHDRDEGVFMATNRKSGRHIPFDFPSFCMNRYAVTAFNRLYYHYQIKNRVERRVSFDHFFFPLDGIEEWNRIYGKRGLLQYQCVIPPVNEYDAIEAILTQITQAGEGSFLAVLKKFGDVTSPGVLSFPRPGTTLALDFPLRGEKTLNLLERLDGIVRESGGAVYPAKDARMSAASFRCYFPNWQEFANYIDPGFSSSFWRRVMSPMNGAYHDQDTDSRSHVSDRTRDRKAFCQ